MFHQEQNKTNKMKTKKHLHTKTEDKENMETATKHQDQLEGHRLQTGWTIWYDKKQKKTQVANYEENLVKLGTFFTVEDFWRYYTHLLRPSELSKESNYHVFREGLKPMWETFPKGGCFIKKIKKIEDNMLGRMWEELLFATIGEFFEDPDVVGVVLSIRPKEDALSIWNKDHQNLSLRFKIGEKLKEIWELPMDSQIEYKNHSASMKDRSTYRSHTHRN